MFSKQVPFLQEFVYAILFSDDYWNHDIIVHLTCIDVYVYFLMCIENIKQVHNVHLPFKNDVLSYLLQFLDYLLWLWSCLL